MWKLHTALTSPRHPLLFLSFLCHPYILTTFLENFYSFLVIQYTDMQLKVTDIHAMTQKHQYIVSAEFSVQSAMNSVRTSTLVSAVFMLSVLSTESTSLLGTPDSVTSLRSLFLLKPTARTRLALSLLRTLTSTFPTWAQEAASSSCAHSSSLKLPCRYKPQHRGAEVTPYKNNKHTALLV